MQTFYSCFFFGRSSVLVAHLSIRFAFRCVCTRDRKKIAIKLNEFDLTVVILIVDFYWRSTLFFYRMRRIFCEKKYCQIQLKFKFCNWNEIKKRKMSVANKNSCDFVIYSFSLLVNIILVDVNMVAEPKPHQIGRKRQNITKTGNDWDYYYDRWILLTNAKKNELK